MITYTLDNGEEYHAAAPRTFQLPPRAERETIAPGQLVKLIFHFATDTEAFYERMWVIVKERTADGRYLGVLDNDPDCTEEIRSGIAVIFGPEHIIQIWREPSARKPWWKLW